MLDTPTVRRSLAKMAIRSDDYDTDLEGEDGQRRVRLLFVVPHHLICSVIIDIYRSDPFLGECFKLLGLQAGSWQSVVAFVCLVAFVCTWHAFNAGLCLLLDQSIQRILTYLKGSIACA